MHAALLQLREWYDNCPEYFFLPLKMIALQNVMDIVIA